MLFVYQSEQRVLTYDCETESCSFRSNLKSWSLSYAVKFEVEKKTLFIDIMATGVGRKEDESLCSVCHERMEIFAVGRCDHAICFRCAVRMRVLCDQMYCAICRADLQQVCSHRAVNLHQLTAYLTFYVKVMFTLLSPR